MFTIHLSDGSTVEVPPEVEAAGGAAIETFTAAQLASRAPAVAEPTSRRAPAQPPEA
jgi:hypothetical protein